MSSLRLVLVGKMGAGKSSTGNTILGKEEFNCSFSAVTTECQRGEGEVDGRPVTVVDTPGVTDLHVSMEDAKDRVAECFSMSAPGPHAFLLVLKLSLFTPEEKQAADVIQEVFGEAALKHTIVLFTHGDELENPDALETSVKECAQLTILLDKVNWRYHVFNNKENDRTQVIELLNKIDKMVGERGHYIKELFQKEEEKRKQKQKECGKEQKSSECGKEKQVETVNLFRNFCLIAASTAVGGGGAAAVGAALGALIGAVAGGTAGAAVGGPAGAVPGIKAGAVAGTTAGAIITGVTGAVAGAFAGAAHPYIERTIY